MKYGLEYQSFLLQPKITMSPSDVVTPASAVLIMSEKSRKLGAFYHERKQPQIMRVLSNNMRENLTCRKKIIGNQLAKNAKSG